ncbi:hypothetical protein A2V82_02105 [candidate division KSB1 bacterium RBG_16_48_16]|nr:MAG: hypothetical protein A2V82_02105 [candidate division KSB1 bacterium RBG_16_48_16]
MKSFKAMLVLALVFFVFSSSYAIVTNGGKGLPHTKSAWVQERGRLTFLSQTRFWGKVGQFPASAAELQTAYTIWDVQGLVSLNYGMGPHFELTITPLFYQDVHQGESEEYPWDTFIGLKIGSFGPKASSLTYGLELNTRFPTGERHNVLFEDYTAGRVEWGFTGLASYAYDPLYPEDSFNLHANLGYLHHNDVGQELVPRDLVEQQYLNEVEVLHPSQELLYAIGFTIPSESFDYGIEMFGNAWLQKPPLTAASRESYLYLNASVKYKPYRWFDFIVSGEYRLTADKDETVGPRAAIEGMPNYNTWRINVGAKMTLLPTSVFRTSERDILMQKAQSRRELFEQIVRERRETESAEEELERIKEERRKAERELERLRQILEGQNQQQ